MKRSIQIGMLVLLAALAVNTHVAGQKKPASRAVKADSTMVIVSVADLKKSLQTQLAKVQAEGNAVIQQIQGQLQLLEGIAQDSIAVKKQGQP